MRENDGDFVVVTTETKSVHFQVVIAGSKQTKTLKKTEKNPKDGKEVQRGATNQTQNKKHSSTDSLSAAAPTKNDGQQALSGGGAMAPGSRKFEGEN